MHMEGQDNIYAYIYSHRRCIWKDRIIYMHIYTHIGDAHRQIGVMEGQVHEQRPQIGLHCPAQVHRHQEVQDGQHGVVHRLLQGY